MKPLAGVRVLDLTQAYSGPFCTMHLADHGAEVIKIERIGSGDQSRTWPPFKNDFSAMYAYINRNKRGLALDITSEEGKSVFKRLVKEADVVVENFRVGTMEKLGLSYEALREINPRLIYGSISGFGLEGPWAQRPCYDIVAQAVSGMMSITGFPDGPPTKIGPSVGDNYAGSYLCIGICMALYQRHLTGEGRRIDVAMVDALFSVMESFVPYYTVEGKHPIRQGNIDPGIAPFDSFRAKDGEFVMGCGTDKFWASLCTLMDREELRDDPRYDTNLNRCNNYLPDLKNTIEEWSTTLTVDELEPLFVGAGIPFGRIMSIPEITEHHLIKQRNMLWEVYQPGINDTIRIPGTPIKLHGEEDKPAKAAPLVGEDSDAILAAVGGYSPEEIARLRERNVI